MAIPFATVGEFARMLQNSGPTGALRGVIQAERENRLARSQNLANQTSAAKLAQVPAMQRANLLANRMAQLKLQQQPQVFQQALALKQQQERLARLQSGLVPARQKLLGAQTVQATTRSQFTPEAAAKQALDVQKLKNEAIITAAKIKNQSQDPFAKNQATQLGKDLGTVGVEATDAQKGIVLFSHINNALAKASYVGPGGDKIAWTTPAGQTLGRLLAQAQMGVFAKLHNIRNVREFNKALQQIGTQNLYRSALQTMVNEHLHGYKQSINKLKFYHNYVTKEGGRDPQQAQIDWEKQSVTQAGDVSGQNIANRVKSGEIQVSDLNPQAKQALVNYYRQAGIAQ